jgi:hypothetical protein
MTLRTQFEQAKETLLGDETICKDNRGLFREFFEFEERKLKRRNGLSALDEACYKTLYGYIQRFRNVNKWFRNKPWRDLTREDIQGVYDGLEDGTIKNMKGLPFKDRSSYYNKVLKSKPFRMVGKSEMARDVIEFSTPNNREVRFITEETFHKLASVVSKPEHLLLLWLAWDIGENIDALLKLTKQNFTKQQNKQTNEFEYLVNLPREKIKRTRKTRTEPTLYSETFRFAEMVLSDLNDHEPIFGFGYRQAVKLLRAAADKSGATCLPNNQPITWKDLRSGMACHLLKSGWSREEVDARLGHTPQSSALNSYLSYLAIDREKPKKRLFDSSIEDVKNQLEDSKRRETLLAQRIERTADDNDALREELKRLREEVAIIRRGTAKALGKAA